MPLGTSARVSVSTSAAKNVVRVKALKNQRPPVFAAVIGGPVATEPKVRLKIGGAEFVAGVRCTS